MAGILFTHSYFLRFDPKQWKAQQPYLPLGTLYAAAVANTAGHNISFFDTMFAERPEDIQPVLEEKKPDYVVIYDDGFNYLTKMCLTNMREAAFKMASLASKSGAKVINCSSDSTDHYELYLKNGSDAVMLGEGEETLKELLYAMENELALESIAGIAFPKDDEIIITPKRPVIRDLDTLPEPLWNLVDIRPYRDAWMTGSGYFSINYATTRGCPFKCNWCAKPIYGNRYNSHSPARVVSELKMLQDLFEYDQVWFCDDIFGLKPGWVQEFADLSEAAGLKLKYKIQSRADLLLQDDTIEALARSGADEIWIGAESGSQKILDAMDKGITTDQIHEATAKMRKYGIKPCFFLQFGYPGEEKEDIQATIDMLLDLMPHNIGISVSYPLPGTKFYE